MKVAISSKGKELNSDVDDVFGRCSYFIIAEIKDKEIINFEAIENMSKQQLGRAGVSAAQTVADKGVEAVITANIGPRALDVLNQFNIGIYNGAGIVKEVLQEFIEEKLEKIN